ncbi:MAG TPA: cytochrome P450 [Acidimicrobiales bacterium]|nr:cytochrome P450 [Acidimicrobiales bacterium]
MPDDLIEFDPFSDTFFDDPYATYGRLRDESPVYLNEQYGFYALSRYADVVAAHGDPARFVSSYGVTVELLLQKRPMKTNMMIVLDPPEHTQQRKLVSQAFTRRAIQGIEPLVASIISDFLDRLVGHREFDVVAEFAALFPVEVISAMLGVPEADRQQVRIWVDTFLHREKGNPNTTQAGMEASLNMAGYFLELARDKRRHPDGLLVTKLIEAVVTDEDGEEQHLSDDDVAAFSVLIAGAGSETVTKLIGSGIVLFDQHPDQWDLIRADAAAIPAAVEEILRMHPPSQYQGRFAVEDVAFDGGTIPAGSPVLLLTGAATRDPREFDAPDDFDITRGGHTTVAFGYGAHSCLGAWLARMESRLALEEIRSRWPRLAVDHDGLRRVNMSNVAGYSHVPVTAIAG